MPIQEPRQLAKSLRSKLVLQVRPTVGGRCKPSRNQLGDDVAPVDPNPIDERDKISSSTLNKGELVASPARARTPRAPAAAGAAAEAPTDALLYGPLWLRSP